MKNIEETGSSTIDVHGIARVEGEGALHVRIESGELQHVELEIFEPPRFFEAFLRGRSFEEPPDITARICGICPVAYQMSACLAIEDASGVEVSEEIRQLRRLLYCGEWIQSHVLHVFLLHAPDFFGLEDAVDLAKIDKNAVERGLFMKKVGNKLMEAVGGRAIHPVNVKVGGFYSAPKKRDLELLLDDLKKSLEYALWAVDWVSKFEFPDVETSYPLVALSNENDYPIESGVIASTSGLELSPKEFLDTIVESHVARSSALHSKLYGQDVYLTGPMARFNLNYERLTPMAKQAAVASGIEAGCRNPFKTIIMRTIETVVAFEEAIRLIENYTPPKPSYIDFKPKAGMGYGATEAPRGLILHRYELDGQGIIKQAQIVPPTSQNQAAIEEDLKKVVEANMALEKEDLTRYCETAIRNHDPCISCSAHFLDVDIDS
ncbi:MAG: Ni/Fe hydrogenase subunit alpha [Firmicutes bacterium]|nr:Ni/Fe hydrogenase subunit alpha [Bacillota bacterium]